jgi:hypothetical protein
VDGLASRDCGGNQRLLHAVQIVQRVLQHGDTRRPLRERQRVVRHPLDLAHDEGKHSFRKESR